MSLVVLEIQNVGDPDPVNVTWQLLAGIPSISTPYVVGRKNFLSVKHPQMNLVNITFINVLPTVC
uniref:Uncharacterized protein n=1 Tax=Naja naja TaxID=35670 RepID=A0A8C6VTD1_NAJNA